MSLETAIHELVEVTKSLIALRTEAIEKVTSAAKPTPAEKSKLAPKDKLVEAKREITDSPEDRQPADEAPANEDPIAKAITDYMGVEDADERAARKAKVREILAKVGAKKHSEIPAAKHKAFLNTMNKLIEAGDLIQKDEPDGEDGDGDDLLD